MEALAALGGLDRPAAHSQMAAAVRVVLAMKRDGKGRHLHRIGLLSGNPVTVRVVWEAGTGPGPAWEEFLEVIS